MSTIKLNNNAVLLNNGKVTCNCCDSGLCNPDGSSKSGLNEFDENGLFLCGPGLAFTPIQRFTSRLATSTNLASPSPQIVYEETINNGVSPGSQLGDGFLYFEAPSGPSLSTQPIRENIGIQIRQTLTPEYEVTWFGVSYTHDGQPQSGYPSWGSGSAQDSSPAEGTPTPAGGSFGAPSATVNYWYRLNLSSPKITIAIKSASPSSGIKSGFVFRVPDASFIIFGITVTLNGTPSIPQPQGKPSWYSHPWLGSSSSYFPAINNYSLGLNYPLPGI